MKILIASEIFKDGVSKYTYNEAEDLEIIGDIPANAEVEIKSEINNGVVIKRSSCANLTIIGNVGQNAKISSEGNITVDGDVRENALIKTTPNDVSVEDAEETGYKYKIDIQKVYEGATIKAEDECVIEIGIAYKGANIKVEDGCVIKIGENKGAIINMGDGCAIINTKKTRENSGSQNTSRNNTGGFSFTIDSTSGNISVNAHSSKNQRT